MGGKNLSLSFKSEDDFNLILLKHFASGLGPINIGFLLGMDLE